MTRGSNPFSVRSPETHDRIAYFESMGQQFHMVRTWIQNSGCARRSWIKLIIPYETGSCRYSNLVFTTSFFLIDIASGNFILLK